MLSNSIRNNIKSTQQEVEDLRSDLRLVRTDAGMKAILDKIEILKDYVTRREFDLYEAKENGW